MKLITTALLSCTAFIVLSACGSNSPDSSELQANAASARLTLQESSDAFTLSTGAGLVYQVRKSSGDIFSLRWRDKELQQSGKGSHLSSGLGSAKVSASVSPSGTTALITIETTGLTHYLASRRGENNIYMATFAAEQPSVGELRWITRMRPEHFDNFPEPSRIQNGSAIESKDVFLVNNQTRSKYYGNEQARKLGIRGLTGPGIGVFMAYGNRESSSGGPFFRDIQNQTGLATELYNYMNSGHNQTEAFRINVLHGPYVLMFTDGATPSQPSTGWMEALNLKGWVKSRGYVSGKAIGLDPSIPALVGFHNESAQYWTEPHANGNFSSPAMKPGVYTQTLYQGELAVATRSLTVTANETTTEQNIRSSWASPEVLWRIGKWDGTPLEFSNGKNFSQMHPSDTRNSPWTSANFSIGQPSEQFPAAQWMNVNNANRISFVLSASDIANRQLRIGTTVAIANGRPLIQVNNWTSSLPAPSAQPKSRSLTIGSYRGNNTLYTYDIPASAFVAGVNTLEIRVNSGSSGGGFLSPGIAFDAIELVK